MLGDVYGEPTAAPAPKAPEWADDERLDEAFDGWTPGPSEDASQAERSFFAGEPDDDPAPLADDLATALSEAVLAESNDGGTNEAEGEVDERSAPTPYQPRKNAFDFASLSNDDDVYKAMARLRHDEEMANQAAATPPVPAPEPPAPAPAPVMAPIEPMPAMAPAPVEPRDLDPAPQVAVGETGPWQRDHDDILPGRGGKARRGLQLSFRRR